MNNIKNFSSINQSIEVEAGVILESIHEFVDKENFLFPLSMASKGSCCIGGNLATNAGGIGVLKYGNARDLCLGLEVVLADGSIMNDIKTLKKDNTGYDLKNLFIGSEGSLGIITRAVLRLYPAPLNKIVGRSIQIPPTLKDVIKKKESVKVIPPNQDIVAGEIRKTHLREN